MAHVRQDALYIQPPPHLALPAFFSGPAPRPRPALNPLSGPYPLLPRTQVIEVLERPNALDITEDMIANRRRNIDDVRAILPLTEGGLDVNVRFTKYDAQGGGRDPVPTPVTDRMPHAPKPQRGRLRVHAAGRALRPAQRSPRPRLGGRPGRRTCPFPRPFPAKAPLIGLVMVAVCCKQTDTYLAVSQLTYNQLMEALIAADEGGSNSNHADAENRTSHTPSRGQPLHLASPTRSLLPPNAQVTSSSSFTSRRGRSSRSRASSR